MIATNPAEAVDIPKQEKKQMKVWDTEQVKLFLNGIEKPKWKAIFYLAFSTGMRQSEILGLRWKDIDLDSGSLAVRHGLHYFKGKFTFEEPKTKNSKRTISLPTETIKALRAYKREQNEAYMKAKENHKAVYDETPDLVFRSRVGTPINPRNVVRKFTEIQTDLKISTITFHEIRHTHATMLLQSGEHIKVVSERLGHASVSTTLDLYSHVLPNMQQSAASKIQGMLFSD
jgi:integrase